MNEAIRLFNEETEKERLSPRACLSHSSKGRLHAEEECPIRTVFQRDRDRIIHSKSFRRLKHKTQVFLSPEEDHYRTRLTHTLEVAQIARTIARALRLNEDLTESIALGHDLGHTPFGHACERSLNRIMKEFGGFRHNEQSLRVVDYLEHGMKGLNLTFEVRDGILNHRTSSCPSTPEGQVVRLSDKIAYINHDIDDATRAGIISADSIPLSCISVLGKSQSQRINTMVYDVVNNSFDKDVVSMSSEIANITSELRSFLFDTVYIDSVAKKQESKAEQMIEMLFEYYLADLNRLPVEYRTLAERFSPQVAICDYVSGMTDSYAVKVFSDIFVAKSWGWGG